MIITSIIKFLNKYYDIQGLYSGSTARNIYLKNNVPVWNISVNKDMAYLQEHLNGRILSVDGFNTSVTIKHNDVSYVLFPLKKIELIKSYYNYKFTDSVEDDAASKDFTINSLYYDPIKEKWFDYFNGINDINSKIIKFVGDPDTRILESKVRILKAPVLNALLGNNWIIEAHSSYALTNNKLKLSIVNPKQVANELTKLCLHADQPSLAFRLMVKFGLLDEFFPELLRCINIEQSNKSTGLDLFNHIMYTLDAVPKNNNDLLLMRITALLHDIGKPYTKIHVNDELHFFNHENVGAFLSEKILNRWGFSKNIISPTLRLIQNHLFDATPNKSEVSIRKLVQKVGPDLIHNLLDLRIADRLGTGRKNISMANIEWLRHKINSILAETDISKLHLNITDSDIIESLENNTDFIKETIVEVKNYLRNGIVTHKIKNKTNKLIVAIKDLSNIKCPLDLPHLYKTHSEIITDSADVFPTGDLKCGIYCNFTCSINKGNKK